MTLKAVAVAPSKVIIIGEHFVVHGAWALAAAIGRGTTVEVRPSDEFLINGRPTSPMPSSLRPTAGVIQEMARLYGFKTKLRVDVTSRVPVGSGLGSSASAMVAVASAVSSFSSLGLGEKEIIESASVGERMIHGRPSGIDATVCGLGGVLLFRQGEAPRRVDIMGQRRIIVVNSGKARSTKRLVSKVSGVSEENPHFFTALARSVGDLALQAAERLGEGDGRGLGSLMTLNQAALSALGVSTPQLDGLIDRMLWLGCYGAKLTGAGGGGCVLAVAPEGKEKRIISEVTGRGLEAFAEVIPVGGVKSWLER